MRTPRDAAAQGPCGFMHPEAWVQILPLPHTLNPGLQFTLSAFQFLHLENGMVRLLLPYGASVRVKITCDLLNSICIFSVYVMLHNIGCV